MPYLDLSNPHCDVDLVYTTYVSAKGATIPIKVIFAHQWSHWNELDRWQAWVDDVHRGNCLTMEAAIAKALEYVGVPRHEMAVATQTIAQRFRAAEKAAMPKGTIFDT